MSIENDRRTTLYQLEFDIPHHEAIAAAAQQLLTPAATSEVAKILASVGCTTLREVAGWADKIKHRKPNANDDTYTKEFMQQNPNSGEWHFVDLPLGCSGYDPVKYERFCRGPNVVGILTECIQVLEQQSTRFLPINALRLIVHLVGDVHQPLHVGCKYLQTLNATISLTGDPDVIAAGNLPKDRGGNALILPADAGRTNLHAYWDSGLGGEVTGQDSSFNDKLQSDEDATSAAVRKILSTLGNSVRGLRSPAETTSVELEMWPKEWATHSLEVARQAYVSIAIIGSHSDSRSESASYDVNWEGRAAYNERCRGLLVEQMSLGAKNLAAVINRLYES